MIEKSTTNGKSLVSVFLIHGGPGAAGTLTPLAELLAPEIDCFAPWQTVLTIDGQIEELREQITLAGDLPVTLVGHSWGAWLVWLFAAQYPQLVKKIILVTPGVFEEDYVKNLMPTRLARLSTHEQNYFQQLMGCFQDPAYKNKDFVMAEFGSLMRKADMYDEVQQGQYEQKISFEVYDHIWPQAAALRKTGALLAAGEKITCPVVSFHGDYDSTPPEGIINPLSQILSDYHWYILKNCGHYPWAERYARDEFLKKLKQELL